MIARWMGALLLAAAGCTAAAPSNFDLASNDSSAKKPTIATGGFAVGDAGAATTVESNDDGCDDAAKLVYVLSLEGDMYSFAPAEKKFTKIATLDCGAELAGFSPISMAVDRNAIAWVNLRSSDSSTNALVKFDINAKTCTKTQVTGSIGGMAFSTDGTSTTETLYVSGDQSVGGGLSKIDTTAETLLPIANYAADENRELTGTGDGRLFGFFVEDGMSFAQIDKTKATLASSVPLDAIAPPLSPMFAFSFWGGDFFFYTATSEDADDTSTVARYSPSDGSLDTAYMTNIGFHITGAGVSTCAPTTSAVK